MSQVNEPLQSGQVARVAPQKSLLFQSTSDGYLFILG